MGKQVYHGAQACSGTNLRKCQDLGDSILLILGSFILLNVGINVLWKHLKNSLRILFHHFFPKDKQPVGLNSRPICIRCITDPKNMCSRLSSRFHRHPNFLLGHANHLGSWIPDRNDENISRCCWMSPQCGHGRAPTEAPWELWKEEMLGAGKAPQATVKKIQASFYSRPETSPQIPKINKLDTASLSSPQENKTTAPNDSPSYALTQTLTFSSTNTHEHPSTQSQTQISEHTQFSAHTPPAHEPDSISAPIPALSEAPVPDDASSPTSSNNPAPTPPFPLVQAPTHSQAHAMTQAQPHNLPPTSLQVPAPAQGLAHSPDQTSAHISSQPLTQAPAYAPFQSQGHDTVQIPIHTMTHPQADDPVQAPQASAQAPSHSLLHPYAHTPVPGPISALAPPPTFSQGTCVLASVPVGSSATSLSLSMTMATTKTPTQVHATTSTSTLPPVPSIMAPFGPNFSTGQMVYDPHRIKQNIFLKHNSQNSGYFRKDLNILSKPQEVKDQVISGTAEQTPKQHGGDSAEPPAGSILGYLELGNMEWKISDNAKDKFSQPKTFPYFSFHPCCSERKKESQAPVYPKFLLYAQDSTPSKPCLHSPSSAQSAHPTIPTPCSLSLPLVSPRTFVVPQSNHQKPPNLTKTPTFLPTSKFPQTVSSPQFSIPSQFPTISQTLIQPLNPENQGLGLQKTLFFAKDFEVPRNPGLTQDPGLQKNPCLTQDLGVHMNPGLTQDSGLHKNQDLPPNPGLHENPDFTLSPSLHKNSGFHKFPGCTQESYLYMNPNISQDSCLQKNLNVTQDSGLRSSAVIQDAGVLRSTGLIQPSSLHKNVFNQAYGQRTLSFMQDSLVYRNVPLNQDTVIEKNKDLSPVTNQKRPDPSQDCGRNSAGSVSHPGVCGNVGHTQDYAPQKSPCRVQDSEVNKSLGLTQESSSHKRPDLVQTSCLHKSSGLTQDSGDYKSLGLTQGSGIYRVPDLTQDSVSHRNSSCVNATEAEKRLDFNQNVSIYSLPCQDPNLQECQAIDQDPGPHQHPALDQSYGFKTPGLTQQTGLHKDSGLTPDFDFNKKPSLDSAQVVEPFQTTKLTSSPVKSFVCKTDSQKDNTEQDVSCTCVPVNQSSCPSKAQVISTDLKTFSEVPVLVELQSPPQRLGSQHWVYHTVNKVPTACQKYRQMSMPPKSNWRPHCPGPGPRMGHVAFDSHQKQLVTGRQKCEALSPRRLRQEAPRNSEETQKEWGYQNVMRTLEKEGVNKRQE